MMRPFFLGPWVISGAGSLIKVRSRVELSHFSIPIGATLVHTLIFACLDNFQPLN